MTVINGDNIRKAITMAEVVDIVEGAFAALSDGTAHVPNRIQIEVPDHNGTTLFMPGFLKTKNEMAIKVVSVYPDNPKRGMPSINALVMVMDTETGTVKAIIDGTVLTGMRTGAAGGVGTRLLARQNAETLAIFGAGIQGRYQFEATLAVRDIREVRVYDPIREASERFVSDLKQQTQTRITVASSPSEAIHNSDIICTTTTSDKPVFDDADVAPGTHINAVGIYKPHMHEIPPETVARARIAVDSREACLEEAGDLLIPVAMGLRPKNETWTEIGEISNGSKTGRESDTEITLFKTVGVSVQDVMAAAAVYKNATDRGIGQTIDL